MAQVTDLPLNKAYSQYVSGLKENRKKGISQDLNRFVRWCGSSGPISGLTPQTVASYCEWLGRSGGDVAKKLDPVKKFLTYLKNEELVKVSLATHARVPKNKALARIAKSRQAAPEIAELTQEGFKQLTERLEALKADRTKVVSDIGRAMADKDFRENAPLDAAKERQGLVESQIRELEQTLSSAVITGGATGKKAQRVAIGKTVVVKTPGNSRKVSYLVVHPREANPVEKKISSESPVGKALMNRQAGDEVQVIVPKGSIQYLIEKVTG